MDLVGSGANVLVLMEHTNKGVPKIVEECTYPLTGKGVITTLVTEMGVFKFPNKRIKLIEIAKEYTLE